MATLLCNLKMFFLLLVWIRLYHVFTFYVTDSFLSPISMSVLYDCVWNLGNYHWPVLPDLPSMGYLGPK